MIGAFLLASLMSSAANNPQDNFPPERNEVPSLIPSPQSVKIAKGELVLRNGDTIVAKGGLAPLAKLCVDEFRTAFDIKLLDRQSGKASIVLRLDKKLAEEQYRLVIGNKVDISGGSYQAVAYGTTTLLQWARWYLGGFFDHPQKNLLPPPTELRMAKGTIDDKPAFAYRGAMVDVARKYHSTDTLKQVIDLCRFYKVRYIQIHLTDDQAFTFPSTAFPLTNSSQQHGGPTYTLAELKGLVKYADTRGVTIVPEFDIPGHSAALIRTMPDLFKIKNTKPYEHHATVNFANPDVIKALDTIIGEMCDVFKSSPYFHIGGDEADIANVAQHPDFQKLIAEYGLTKNPEQELYRRFLGQMNEIVKKRGKKMIVWEGFGRDPESKFPIPKDVTVMEFESAYQTAPELIKDGYTVINAAWTPLYIVNRHVWKPKKVYDWSINEFGRVSGLWQTVTWVNTDNAQGIAGAQACEWEQPEYLAVQGFLGVLPAMSERVWNSKAKQRYPNFEDRLGDCSSLLGYLLSPLSLDFEGILETGENEFDNMVFEGEAVAFLSRRPEGCSVRYTTDGTPPKADTPDRKDHLSIDRSMTIRVQAFDKNGKPFGGEFARTLYKQDPKTPNLATGKPVTCSGGTQGPQTPDLAVDGNLDLGSSWWAAPAPQWIQVDLQKAENLSRIVVFPYWDGRRYYQYTVEVSTDGNHWKSVADRSDNTIPSSSDGDTIKLTDCNARYLRVNMLKCSANEGVHIVEIEAWP